MKKIFLLLFIFTSLNYLSKLSAAESTLQFIQGADTLVVYKDVPGLAPSDKFTIRVRSAATNNEWVQCFANYTYNRYYELPVPSTNPPNNMAYIRHCGGWSHTYANVEMSNNSPIEVEISKIGSALLDGVSVIEKSAMHPSHKVFDKRDENGKVYFKISKPCQVVIDINGQMDDHNAGYTEFAQIGPVHAISFFANPVIEKPATSGAGVLYVTAGTKPDMNAVYSKMVFGPGVHNIGAGFKIFAQRSYYIPGDAIVYGSFDNSGSTGEGISITGYGTLSGLYIPHYQNLASDNALHYPTYTSGAHVAITINDAVNVKIQGITIIDPANFSGFMPYNSNSIMSWVKAITWRVNGDGCSLGTTTDCFYRTSDDMPSVGGKKIRLTFWKDTNGNINRLRNFNPGEVALVEDCDFLYNRRRPGASGSVWPLQNADHMKFQKQILVDITLKNIRFHDKKGDMPIFALNSDGVSFNGLKFINVSCYTPFKYKNQITGTAATPWDRGIVFDNVTFNHDNGQPPVLLTKDNLNTYFTTNEYAKDLWFRMPGYFKVTKNVNPTEGRVTLTTDDHIKVEGDTSYIEKSTITLKATALPGYDFTGWSGDTISTSNPIKIVVTGNKTFTANFVLVGMKTLTINTPVNGIVVNTPTGNSHSYNSIVKLTAKPAIGYKFDSWSGDLSSNNIDDSIKMNTDKTITANFVKTNNFAVNYGGDQYIAADGTVYVQTPNGYTRTNTIAGTDDDFLYQSEKSGKTFSLDYPVDNGEYTVTLKFAEVYHTGAGRRVFNVTIEGIPVLTNFDIFAEAGGNNKALDKTYQVTVTDGILNIGFTTIADNAKISAIKITNGIPVSLTTTIGGKVSGGGGFPAGQSVTVSATSNLGYYFVNWKDKSGAVVSTDSIYTFNLVAPVELQANFGKYVVVTIPNPIGGTVTGAGYYKQGQSVTVKATPDAEYKFVNWTINSVFVMGYTSYTFTATNSVELQANFTLKTGLSEMKNVNISIYPNPATDYIFFNSENKLISKIQLVDLTGKIVYTANVQLHNGSVDLKEISKGMYIVKIYTKNSIVTKKISIN